jgi:hypothetical protein
MTTANSNAMDSTKVLLFRSKCLTEDIKWSAAILFAQLLELVKYVCENMGFIDAFVLIVPGDVLKDLVRDPVYKVDQVRRIYVVYDNDKDLKQYKDDIQDELGKLQFCHERNLKALIAKLKATDAVNPPGSVDRGTVNDVTSSWGQDLSTKRTSAAGRSLPEPKRFASTSKHGFPVKNIEKMDPHYVCRFCKFLFRDPRQLICGHRMCQSCIEIGTK